MLFFKIFPYVHSILRNYFMKKRFYLYCLLHFTKKLGRSSYDITMTYYDVILIFFLFRFVANVWDSIDDHIGTSFLFIFQNDFYITHEHVVAFCLFLLQKDFDIFLYFFWKPFFGFFENFLWPQLYWYYWKSSICSFLYL